MDPRATDRRLRAIALWFALALATAAPQADAQKGAAPPPFAYLGTLDQGGERYAVVAREQSVFLVRAGEAIGGEYRVQSIAQERLLLVNLASGAVQALVRDAPAVTPPPRLPDATEEAVIPPAPSEPAGEGARPGYAH